MDALALTAADHPSVQGRADELYLAHHQEIVRRTDRVFAGLMVFQWLGGIAAACWISPKTWAGDASQVHLHVYAAVFLGGIISSLPVLMALLRPGNVTTRHTIAVAQMLWSALLIHLTGGRIETHFHVFGSLAFLAFYRDWRVIVTASAVVAADHLLRELFWPQSVYGVLATSRWRWLEHAGWVAFEDAFLIFSCIRSRAEMREVARRQAWVEAGKATLEKANVQLEESNRAKRSFLANMSHEIRTPMTAIVGYADMMLEPEQTPSDRQDCLQVIRRNARHLLEVINDILDLSKIEADKMTVEQIHCDLPQLAADIVSLMRPRAVEKGLDFRLVFDGEIPSQVHTDPLRLKQILMNVLGNAIKFTAKGSICLRIICRRSESGSGSAICFEVIDTGIGISAEQMERLFQPFTQADESTTRRFGGTGLGLIISRRMARLLGGDIAVESRPGVGSTFTITVEGGPLEGIELLRGLSETMLAPPTSQIVPRQRVRLVGRILFAEDGPDNQRLVSSHLRRAGAEVVLAENGRIALELAQAQKFDLILMDMQMPELDGYRATAQLRQRGFALPIIALTAHAIAEDRAKCLRAGCTEYLSKPIDRDVLLRTLARHMPSRLGPAADASDASASPRPAPQRAPQGVEQGPGGGGVRSGFADDPEMTEVLTEFIAELPQKVEQMLELLRQQDLAELRRVVHQLKGAGGGYGFSEITEAAARAEVSIHGSLGAEKISAEVADLVQLLRRVEGYAGRKEGCGVPNE